MCLFLQKAMSLLAEAEKRGEGNFKPYVMCLLMFPSCDS